MKTQRFQERGIAREMSDRDPLQPEKRAYRPPRLTCWGDVRDLTLGGSAGQFDSGNAMIQQPP